MGYRKGYAIALAKIRAKELISMREQSRDMGISETTLNTMDKESILERPLRMNVLKKVLVYFSKKNVAVDENRFIKD